MGHPTYILIYCFSGHNLKIKSPPAEGFLSKQKVTYLTIFISVNNFFYGRKQVKFYPFKSSGHLYLFRICTYNQK